MDLLTPQDATRFWLSRRACNDLFLLYCFDDTGWSAEALRAAVIARSAEIPELCVRIREHRVAYPAWEPADFDEAQVVVHPSGEPLWTTVEASLGEILAESVPAQRYTWRVHLYRGIRDAPGGPGPALVVVLQLSHALADGRRAAHIARELLRGLDAAARGGGEFGGGSDDAGSSGGSAVHRHPSRRPRPGLGRGAENLAAEAISLLSFLPGIARTVRRGLGAARADSELNSLAEAGEIPSAAPNFAPTRLNRPPAPTHRAVRVIAGENLRIPGCTVTVVALTAISVAMSRYLAAHGESADPLGAQVSLALPVTTDRKAAPHNNYRDVGVDLCVAEPDLRLRARRIAAALAERRIRATHPLQSARDRVTDAIPAPVLRRDIAGYPLDLVPDRISGHTVLSSVHRGEADLSIAGGAVRFTAGFPALGAVMHLTHGLHGLGTTVTLSVHADPQVMDVDDYARLLRGAVREVGARLTAD
ncbi:wax ester/triacylglycerol synthase domain-containing protein [Nocardia africana]